MLMFTAEMYQDNGESVIAYLQQELTHKTQHRDKILNGQNEFWDHTFFLIC